MGAAHPIGPQEKKRIYSGRVPERKRRSRHRGFTDPQEEDESLFQHPIYTLSATQVEDNSSTNDFQLLEPTPHPYSIPPTNTSTATKEKTFGDLPAELVQMILTSLLDDGGDTLEVLRALRGFHSKDDTDITDGIFNSVIDSMHLVDHVTGMGEETIHTISTLFGLGGGREGVLERLRIYKVQFQTLLMRTSNNIQPLQIPFDVFLLTVFSFLRTIMRRHQGNGGGRNALFLCPLQLSQQRTTSFLSVSHLPQDDSTSAVLACLFMAQCLEQQNGWAVLMNAFQCARSIFMPADDKPFHVGPFMGGGEISLQNLQPLCPSVHNYGEWTPHDIQSVSQAIQSLDQPIHSDSNSLVDLYDMSDGQLYLVPMLNRMLERNALMMRDRHHDIVSRFATLVHAARSQNPSYYPPFQGDWFLDHKENLDGVEEIVGIFDGKRIEFEMAEEWDSWIAFFEDEEPLFYDLILREILHLLFDPDQDPYPNPITGERREFVRVVAATMGENNLAKVRIDLFRYLLAHYSFHSWYTRRRVISIMRRILPMLPARALFIPEEKQQGGIRSKKIPLFTKGMQ